jgi:two-component system response regulator DesR
MKSRKTRVLCVDDDPETNEIHTFALKREADIEVVGTVSEVEQVLPALDALVPDVVLLDLQMGAEGPLHLLPELARRMPRVHVIVLSGFDQPELIERVLEAGASGFVTKAVDVHSLAPAIRRVVVGEHPIVRRFERRS